MAKQPTSLTFHPDGRRLIVTLTTNEVFLFDVEHRCLDPWSKAYGDQLPAYWLRRQEILMGATVHPEAPDVLTFYAPFHLSFLDVGRPLVSQEAGAASSSASASTPGKKRAHGRHAPVPTSTAAEAAVSEPQQAEEAEADADADAMAMDVDGVPPASVASTSTSSNTTKMDHRYQSILFAGYLPSPTTSSSGICELVVVERPVLAVLQALGPTFAKHKYGT